MSKPTTKQATTVAPTTKTPVTEAPTVAPTTKNETTGKRVSPELKPTEVIGLTIQEQKAGKVKHMHGVRHRNRLLVNRHIRK
ncbi:MAG: hypothetical protein ACLUR5_10840 [Eubacterium ventriosum]